MKTTLTINKSFNDKMLLLQQTVEERAKEELFSIADYAISISPVDTGAYVESFSFTVGAGRPRGKSSRNKPKVSREQATEVARSNLYGDAERFNLETSDKITLRNNAPHARAVEDKHGYGVFTKVRNKFG
jgi:hypothetical protein